MNDICKKNILRKINHFLNLEDKINLRRVNKQYSHFGKYLINYHIGEIIGNKIGITVEDHNILKDFSFDIIAEISNSLEVKTNKLRINIPLISASKIINIHNKSRKQIISEIKLNTLFKENKVRKYYYNSYILKRILPYTYSIVLS